MLNPVIARLISTKKGREELADMMAPWDYSTEKIQRILMRYENDLSRVKAFFVHVVTQSPKHITLLQSILKTEFPQYQSLLEKVLLLV